jgi:hypothetical protein
LYFYPILEKRDSCDVMNLFISQKYSTYSQKFVLKDLDFFDFCRGSCCPD